MGTLQMYSSQNLASFSSNLKPKIKFSTTIVHKTFKAPNNKPHIGFCRGKIRAVGTIPDRQADATQPEEEEDDEPPSVDFAFVSSVLLPDGSPDVHLRTTVGGQNLRKYMIETNVELYGPYARTLLNCSGGGTCGTCMVEVVEGMELLSPRTDKEKDKLKRKPKNWRLACQTTVGDPNSRGLVVIQQLPEWKSHEWTPKRLSYKEESS
uniref:Photosynthetic NDH subcomplex B 3 n=1 Tax=Pelargonium dichondrifolium TaxID=73194 RepID=A0A0F7CYR8_9ROSI